MAQPKNGKSPTVEERQTLEAEYTFRRIVELHLDPVRGKFDAAHLKEINRRIFQDLPSLGFDELAGFPSTIITRSASRSSLSRFPNRM